MAEADLAGAAATELGHRKNHFLQHLLKTWPGEEIQLMVGIDRRYVVLRRTDGMSSIVPVRHLDFSTDLEDRLSQQLYPQTAIDAHSMLGDAFKLSVFNAIFEPKLESATDYMQYAVVTVTAAWIAKEEIDPRFGSLVRGFERFLGTKRSGPTVRAYLKWAIDNGIVSHYQTTDDGKSKSFYLNRSQQVKLGRVEAEFGKPLVVIRQVIDRLTAPGSEFRASMSLKISARKA